ncbi:MAG: hypothetical protein IT165_32605 [Bryobacterales bacterium]|nr:hypothetical protein [Bryobacterales bacterium]
MSLKLDRDVYFPGEEPIVSVLFRNPTSQVLQVPEPVQGGAGGINLLEAEHDLATVKLLGSPWRHILVGGMLRRPEYGSATVRAHSQPAGTAWGDIPDRCLDHRWLPGEKPALARMGLHVSRE